MSTVQGRDARRGCGRWGLLATKDDRLSPRCPPLRVTHGEDPPEIANWRWSAGDSGPPIAGSVPAHDAVTLPSKISE
jgi:hypothetical protein